MATPALRLWKTRFLTSSLFHLPSTSSEVGQLLKQFATWLKAKQLTQKTIDNHITNVDFYINEFLLYEYPLTEPQEGTTSIDMYFGYWFIKKVQWASASSIKSSAASLKKFYSFLHQQGLISWGRFSRFKRNNKRKYARMAGYLKPL